jgi:hypothetical protein
MIKQLFFEGAIMKTRRVTVVAILAMLLGLVPGAIFAAPR